MSSMPMIAAAGPQTASFPGASGQDAAGAGGLDQLFTQIMQQLQAALEQTPGQLDGSDLPLDGEALPQEMFAELMQFAEHLQGQLSAPEQEQLTELVQQLMADGVPQEQVRQLTQAALLLQDAQLQKQQSPDTLVQLVEQIRTVPEHEDAASQPQSNERSIDELLLLAEKLRPEPEPKIGTAIDPAVEVEVETSAKVAQADAAADAVLADKQESDRLKAESEPLDGLSKPELSIGIPAQAEQRSIEARVEPLAADSRQQKPDAVASVQPIQAEQVKAGAAVVPPSVAPSRAESGGDAGRVVQESASQASSGAGVVSSEQDADGADTRQDGRRDNLRDQSLARWAELRDSVVAQGQKLAQNDAAFKDALGAQAGIGRSEVASLSQAGNVTSLMQLQQAYQASSANTGLLGVGERFGSERWAPAASQRISWMVGQNISSAEIRLDPPELGSLTVRLNIQGDQTSVSFISPHAHVREVLEQQMPRLREMLSDNGLELGQADVSDQSQPQSSDEGDRRGLAGTAGSGDIDALNQEDGGTAGLQMSLALVDYYA
ncbi:MAG: flagellar hook-length control protein FliK [Halopseudomonas sp.]